MTTGSADSPAGSPDALLAGSQDTEALNALPEQRQAGAAAANDSGARANGSGPHANGSSPHANGSSASSSDTVSTAQTAPAAPTAAATESESIAARPEDEADGVGSDPDGSESNSEPGSEPDGASPVPPSAARPLRERFRPRRPTMASLGPWLLALGLTVVYCLDTVSRYYRMAPMSWDLGIFTEAVKQYAHFHAPIADARAPGMDLLGDHFHPIIALLGPFFLLFPSPVTLLVGQAVLFAIATVPITRLGVERIGRGAGYAIGAAFGLSFGLAQAVDVDFHEIAFAVPLIAFALCALLRDKYGQVLFWSLLLLFCKEDLGITMVLPLGLAVILRGRVALGAALSALGTAGSLLAIYVIIPAFNPQHTYPYWDKQGCADPTQQGHQGLTCLIGQTAQNGGGKLELLFLLLSITAFVALRSPLVLLIVPNLMSRFMTTNATYWGTAWHYNAVLMPVLFVAAADGIMRARAAGILPEAAGWIRRRGRGISAAMQRHGAVGMLAVSLALAPQFAYGQFFDPGTFTFDARTSALRHAVSLIPDNVSVEGTLNVLAPLAAKDDTFWVGNINPPTDYVLFDTVTSGFSPPITDPVAFEEQRHPGLTYQIVYQDQWGIFVLKRTS